MKRYRYNSKNKKDRTDKISFFTAFSICIVAIGLALGATYASIGGLDGNLDNDGTGSTYIAMAGDSTEAVDSNVDGVTVKGKSQEETSTASTEAPTTAPPTTEAPTETKLPEASFSADEDDKLQTILQISSSLLYPVSSERVTKEYSEQAVYSETMGDYRPHTGTDFQANTGEAVFAVCDGIVDDISKDDMNGNILKITNGNYSVYYFGLGEDMAVKEGDLVSAGQVVAQVDEIPCEAEDEPHLHMEVRVGGNSIDPMTVISNDK